MDDVESEHIKQSLINTAVRLSELAGRSTLNPRVAEYIDALIEMIDELSSRWGGGGIS